MVRKAAGGLQAMANGTTARTTAEEGGFSRPMDATHLRASSPGLILQVVGIYKGTASW